MQPFIILLIGFSNHCNNCHSPCSTFLADIPKTNCQKRQVLHRLVKFTGHRCQLTILPHYPSQLPSTMSNLNITILQDNSIAQTTFRTDKCCIRIRRGDCFIWIYKLPIHTKKYQMYLRKGMTNNNFTK